MLFDTLKFSIIQHLVLIILSPALKGETVGWELWILLTASILRLFILFVFWCLRPGELWLCPLLVPHLPRNHSEQGWRTKGALALHKHHKDSD